MKAAPRLTRAAVLSLPLMLPLLVVLTAWEPPVSQAQEIANEESSVSSTASVTMPWHMAPSAPSLYRAADEAPRLHVVVMSIPLWGHFKPLWTIAEEMAYRGHTVTCVVEKPMWCETLLRHSQHTAPLVLANTSAATYAKPMVEGNGPLDVQCIVIPPYKEVFTERSFHAMTSEKVSTLMSFQVLFDHMFKHHELALPDYIRVAQAVHATLPLTTLLCDIATYACAGVGRKMNLPVINVFPLTGQLTVGLQAMFPAVGLGFPRHMTLRARIANFAFKFVVAVSGASVVRDLNRARAANDVPLLRDSYDLAAMYGPIIAPILWGLDIPQPLCPNIHQVGPLNTRDQRQPYRRQDLPLDLAAFMDGCSQGVIYANWGTLGLPDPEVEDRLQEALIEAAPLCIVWKRRTVSTRPPPPAARFYVTSWLPSTIAVLKHPNTRMFITHCGDSSVLESVEAAVPVVGFPLFADQADVCQRVKEAGIGIPASETKAFTRAGVVAAIAAVDKNHDAMVRQLHKLRAVAAAYGGPQRAADIIESRQHNLLIHRNTTLEVCTSLSGPLRIEYALIVWSAVLVVGGLVWMYILRRVCRRWSPTSATWSMLWRSIWSAKGKRRTHAAPSRVQAVPRPYKAYKQL
ncbi:putative UDP-glucoronosyl and UDP-glucosyl transferase [Leishmania naiffi]|uniref:UDP-glucoronosyl and UDP-glucosyl transferase n=1 Tax=Leishmania naiffi TaxID=5678 RepID=A0AAW3C2J0_9TRYP